MPIAIIGSVLVAYGGALHVPFLLDGEPTIIENPSIRDIWALGDVLSPPATAGTGGRPLANLSFALSYAISGLEPWSYHALDLIFHALAGLTLYGLLRRTLLLPAFSPHFDHKTSTVAAGMIALLWTVHPLQTQTVTYASQRTEGLMALFYMLALYCFIRGTEGRAKPWHRLAVLACLLGIMCKEVTATAPLAILLYDRTFFAGTFSEALRLRWRLYAGLTATWIPLVFLLVGVSERGVGFNLDVPWLNYVLTQCEAVIRYLGLCVWPHPLVFDYGPAVAESLEAVFPEALMLATVLGIATWAVIRRPVWGFAGAFCLLVLAPTSLVPVTGAPMAENRPYLPLAAIIAFFVITLHLIHGRRPVRILCAVLVAFGITATARRNLDYQDATRLWTDTVRKAPGNHRAHSHLAKQLADTPGREADALTHYRVALNLKPDDAAVHCNLAILLARRPETQAAALDSYATALRLKPNFAPAHYNLANLLFALPGRQADARVHYEAALRFNPHFGEAHHNLANLIVAQAGQAEEALAHYEAALRLKPGYAEMHYNLASLLARLPGRQQAAVAHYATAVNRKR
ncbi:MAG: tetratricopeptide repeat protein [Opitutaceae bacterium]|nr:tetratricopeptide repeat protein [Opitutaceae bacterium]